MTGGFDGAQPPGGNGGARPVGLYCAVGAPHDDDDDVAWFENNRGRRLRLRLMTADERAVLQERGLAMGDPPPGYRYAVVVARRGQDCHVQPAVIPSADVARLAEMDDAQILAGRGDRARKFLQAALDGVFDGGGRPSRGGAPGRDRGAVP